MAADVAFSVGISTVEAKTGRDEIVAFNADIAKSYDAIQKAAAKAGAGLNIGGAANGNVSSIASIEKAVNALSVSMDKLAKSQAQFMKAAQEGVQASSARTTASKAAAQAAETEAQALDRITQRMAAAKAAREAQTQATKQQKTAQDALNASISAGAGGQVSNAGLLATAKAAQDATVSVDRLTKARLDDEAAANALVKSADTLVGRYAPLIKAQQQLANDRAALTKLQKEGTLTETEEAAVIAGLEAKQRNLDVMQKTLGGSTKAQAQHFQNLKYQINDVVTGLISGQPPMLVFTQQGGQIVQALGGMDISLKTVRASTLLMAGGLGVAAVGLAAAIYGASRFSEEFRSLERTISLTGGAAGVTANQIVGMADALADGAGVSKSTAREIQGAYVATGKIGGQVLVSLTEQTKNWAVATNQDTDKAAAQLAGMFSDPARAADDLVAKYGMLAPAQARLIKNYQDQGKLEQAQKVLMDAITPRIAGAAENVSALAQAWEWASKGVSNFIDAAGRGFAAKGPSVADLKATADKAAKDYAADPKGTNWVNGALMSTKEIADYTAQAYAEAFRNAEADAWFAAIKAGDADFQRLQKSVQDFAQSVDPAMAATQAFSNRQEQLDAAVKQGAMSQAEATRILGLYKAQLMDTMSPMQAFAMEAERQGRIVQAQAGVMRDYEAARQAELKKRGMQPGDALPQRVEDTLYDSTMRVVKDKAVDQHRTMTEATEDAKVLARATASMSPAAMVAAQGQVAYNQKLRETKDVGLATQARNDALTKGYAELSGQIGAQVTQLNQQTTAQDRLAAAAGKGEAAMRAATAENNIAAAALRGVGEATARAAENAKELATQKQIHAEFAAGIDLDAAATGRLVKAMGEGISATREAEIYNKAIVQAMKEVPPTYDDAGVATGEFAQHVDAAAAALVRQQDALDSKAFADYEEKLKAQNRQLQLQQKLIGATPSQAARLQVENDINEMLRAQKLTYEGMSDAEKAVIDRIRERSLANADLEQQISRQKDAYDTIANSLEKAFERVGDALVQAFVEGKGSAVDFGNVAKAILSSLLTDLVKMSVIRPFSNAVLGTNYGTIFDLGGGSSSASGGGMGSLGGQALSLGSKFAPSSWTSGITGAVDSWGYSALGLGTPLYGSAGLTSATGGLASSAGVAAVPGGVTNVAATPSVTGVSAGTGLSAYLGAAGIGFGAGMMLPSLLGIHSKLAGGAVGGLGGAGAGALAGTFLFPGVGTLLGAILGGGSGFLGGLLGTQKPSVGKTASADVTVNSGGKSATYGNILTDNEGDPEAGKALGNYISSIFTTAAAGGGTLAKNFGFGQTAKDGYYIAGSVDYKKFGDDFGAMMRYALIDQGGLKDGGKNTLAAIANSKNKDAEEFGKDVTLGASIDAGNTALKEMVKTLSGVTDAAKKATTESFQPMFDELTRAKKLGIGDAYVGLATDQLKAYLDQLRNPPDFTQVQTDMATLTGQFQAARDAYAQLNPAMVTYVDQIEKETKAKIAANFNKSLDQQIAEVSGRGYVNQINGLMDALSANARSLAAVGEPATKANDLYNASLTSLLKTLTTDQLADVAKTFSGDIATLATTISTAATATQQATRFETLFSQIRQENINAEIASLNEQKSAANGLLSSWKNLQSSISQARQSLLVGDLSTLDPKAKMDAALSAYRDALGKAQGGDVDAAGQVSGLAQTALQAARAYYASNEDYARIFNEVSGGLGDVESVASRQVSLQSATVSRLDTLIGVQQDALKALSKPAQSDISSILSGLNAGNLSDLVQWGQRTGSDVLMQVLQTADNRLGQAGNPYRYRAGADVQSIANHMSTQDYLDVGKTIGFSGALDALNPWIVAYSKQSAFEGAVKAWGSAHGYQEGGIVRNGLWGVDSVMAKLAGGEGVLTAPATAAIGAGAVDYINRHHALPANDRWGGSNVVPYQPARSSGGGRDAAADEVRQLRQEVTRLHQTIDRMAGMLGDQGADQIEQLSGIRSNTGNTRKKFVA